MGWITGLVVYFVLWFVVLFWVLPWGVRPPEDPVPGHADSAPDRPRLALKFAVTSLLTFIVWLVIFLAFDSGIIWIRGTAADL